MYDALVDNWWAVVLRGGAAVLFGLLALIVPGLTLDGLITLFSTFAIADGAVTLYLAWRATHELDRRLLLVEGIASAVLGLLALVWSDLSTFGLLLLVAIRAILGGAVELVLALRLRHDGHRDWLPTTTGAATLVAGLVLLLPASGAVAMLWWIAVYAIGVGALLIILGLRLREAAHESANDGGMIAAA